MNETLPKDAPAFDDIVRNSFKFLESEHSMSHTGVRRTNNDPRDSSDTVTYRSDQCRIKISWSHFQLSLSIMIYLDAIEDVDRKYRHIYFEPFIEYLTHNTEKPIIPQIYPSSTQAHIFRCADARKSLFEEKDFQELLIKLASKLQTHLNHILLLPASAFADYHEWFNTHKNQP